MSVMSSVEDDLLMSVIRLEGKLLALQKMCGLSFSSAMQASVVVDEKPCAAPGKLRHTISTASTSYVESSGSTDAIDTPGDEAMEDDDSSSSASSDE